MTFGGCAEDLAKTLANGFLERLSEQAIDGAVRMLERVLTLWVDIPTQVADDEGQALGTVSNLQQYTQWLVAAIAVGAILVSAIRMAMNRSGREAGTLLRGIVVMVVVTGAGLAILQGLIFVGDSYSRWIINESMGFINESQTAECHWNSNNDFVPIDPAKTSAATCGEILDAARLKAGAAGIGGALGALTLSTGPGLLVAIGLSIFLIIVVLVQMLLMFGRSAALVLMAGLLPVAAAAGIGGGAGQQMRNKYLSWLLAFVLYKPAAATIYAASFWLVRDSTNFNDFITGIVLFCMALVALPALMRLIAPAVSMVASGDGGAGMAFAGAAAGAQLATGAMRIGGGSGGGSGGGGGSAAPTGAAQSAGAGGGAAAGGAAAGGAAAAAGPAGAAVVAGEAVVEGAQQAMTAGPKAISTVGGTAATGAGQ